MVRWGEHSIAVSSVRAGNGGNLEMLEPGVATQLSLSSQMWIKHCYATSDAGTRQQLPCSAGCPVWPLSVFHPFPSSQVPSCGTFVLAETLSQ